MTRVTLVTMVALAMTAHAVADTIYLKSGVKLDGKVVFQDENTVRIDIGGKERTFPASTVGKIEENEKTGHFDPKQALEDAKERLAKLDAETGLTADQRRVVKSLMWDLQSTDEAVHEQAKKNLVNFHNNTAPLHQYFAWWLPGLSPRFVPGVLEILAEISPEKAVQLAAEHVEDLHPRSRAMALTVLGIQPNEERIQLLARGMADESFEVRIAAARALGNAKEPAATPLLLEALRAGDPRLVSVTQRALQTIWGDDHQTGELSSHDDWAEFGTAKNAAYPNPLCWQPSNRSSNPARCTSTNNA
jgi:hypothetical protein